MVKVGMFLKHMVLMYFYLCLTMLLVPYYSYCAVREETEA